MPLSLHNRKLTNIFDLLGSEKDENDITFAVGWGLSQSPNFCAHFLKLVLGQDVDSADVDIRLQDHAQDGGFTDIELRGKDFHVIVEAKRDWTLPTLRQLRRYTRRFGNSLPKHALVVMSACTPAYAEQFGAAKRVGDVPVKYICWEQLHRSAVSCCGTGGRDGRLYLKELCGYLEDIMDLQDQKSNLVYVVSISAQPWKWSRLMPIEYITKKKQYFHPYGYAGWPKTPLNYMGFRQKGKLLSIHHVEDCQLVPYLAKHFREINKTMWQKNGDPECPYLVYKLGPAIIPSREVRTGNLFRAARVTAALDLLLTSKTIAEARDRTKARLTEDD